MKTIRFPLKYGYFEFPEDVARDILFKAMPLLSFEDWELNAYYGWRKKNGR